MRSFYPVLALALIAACAGRSPRQQGMTMPNPDGCFVQVWDAPHFAGAADYINGPREYSTLRDLPGGRRWSGRIRSLTVGPQALAIVHADEHFRGPSVRLSEGRRYVELPSSIGGDIESLQIECAVRAE
jgi:hypothetical protein